MSDPRDWAFPFGKHKGEPIGKIPTDYLRYMLGWSELKAMTREKIEREMARRANGGERNAAPALSRLHGELGHAMLREGYRVLALEPVEVRVLQEIYDRLAAGIAKLTGVSADEVKP